MDNQTLNEERKKRGNKIAIIFVVKLLLIYFLLTGFHQLIYSATSPNGRFYNAFVTEHFDYIQGVRSLLIIPATWIIQAFGFHTMRNAVEIMVVGGPILSINYDCLGLNVMSFLVAFAIAFPASSKSKTRLLAISVFTVYVLNVIRIAALALVLAFFPAQQANFKYHHEAFSITIYIIIFIMLYRWIQKKLPALNKADSTV